MSKTKFYETSNNKLINIKNIALIEPSGNYTKLTLDVKDEKGNFIVIEVFQSWSKVTSDIEATLKS